MMKFKSFYSVLLLGLCLVMPACETSDDESNGSNTPPAGALPSARFEPNSLPDEPFADEAMRLVAKDGQAAPFHSLELMADGHYLLAAYPLHDDGDTTVWMSAKADGGLSMRKHRKGGARRAARTRAVTGENGVVDMGYGMEYGAFTKLGGRRYRLANGIEVDLQCGSDSVTVESVAYRNADGTVSHVYVSVSKPALDDAARSLCRSWNLNSEELWAYWNGRYIAHGRQTLKDGEVETYFKAQDDIERDDFLDDDGEMCYKVVFTPMGTYVCFYLDGTTEVALWQWTDEAQGTLHYEDVAGSDDYDDEWDGYVTIRFAGRQMRVYEDYTEVDEDGTGRIVMVTTLTAAS